MIVPVKRLSVTTDHGATLGVRVRGNGAPTLVFVHGFTLESSVWDTVSEHLPDVTAITFDLREHGQSSLSSDHPDLNRLVIDLGAILDAVDRTEIHVVGHSLGAFIALAAQTDPATAERLVSVSAISAMDRSDHESRTTARSQSLQLQLGRCDAPAAANRSFHHSPLVRTRLIQRTPR